MIRWKQKWEGEWLRRERLSKMIYLLRIVLNVQECDATKFNRRIKAGNIKKKKRDMRIDHKNKYFLNGEAAHD